MLHSIYHTRLAYTRKSTIAIGYWVKGGVRVGVWRPKIVRESQGNQPLQPPWDEALDSESESASFHFQLLTRCFLLRISATEQCLCICLQWCTLHNKVHWDLCVRPSIKPQFLSLKYCTDPSVFTFAPTPSFHLLTLTTKKSPVHQNMSSWHLNEKRSLKGDIFMITGAP